MIVLFSVALGCTDAPIPEFVSVSPVSKAVPADEVIRLFYKDVKGELTATLHTDGDEVPLLVSTRTNGWTVTYEIPLARAVQGDWVEISEDGLLGYFEEPDFDLYNGPAPGRIEVLAPSGIEQVSPAVGVSAEVVDYGFSASCLYGYEVEVVVELPDDLPDRTRVLLFREGLYLREVNLETPRATVQFRASVGYEEVSHCFDVSLVGPDGVESSAVRGCTEEYVEPTTEPTEEDPTSEDPTVNTNMPLPADTGDGEDDSKIDGGCSTTPSGATWLASLLPVLGRLRRTA